MHYYQVITISHIKVFKHRYSLDCHQRQTHPLQRITGRPSNSVSVNPPKPIAEDSKFVPENVRNLNANTNMIESESDKEPRTIPDPCIVEPLSTMTALKKQRKRKPTSKDPETQLESN
jgi:hypothetical protein